MSKRLPFAAGSFYHIYNRGCSRLGIFSEPENYMFVLRRIRKYLPDLNCSLLAYCLMPNHFHFLLRQDGAIPAGMLSQRVFNSYTKAYNKRYQRSGTLFEGPYRIKRVDQSAYLIHLCRYIHANPVKAGLVDKPEDWPYSNYKEWVGLRHGSLVDHDFICQNFHTAAEYIAFVQDYLSTHTLPAGMSEYLEELEEG